MAAAEPESPVVVTTNYYVVRGASPGEIRTSMTEARPWKASFAFDARTAWEARCNYTYRESGGQYLLDSVEVKTKVTVTLPVWSVRMDAEQDLFERWWEYLKALSRHEQGHVQYARAATAAVQQRLSALPGFASRHELGVAVHRTVGEVIKEFRSQEAEYDRQTGHGMTQGAVFLPRSRRNGGPD